LWVVLRKPHKHADPLHLLGLLRARRERPRSHPTEQTDEIAASQ